MEVQNRILNSPFEVWLRFTVPTYHWWVGWNSSLNWIINDLSFELDIFRFQLVATILLVVIASFSGLVDLVSSVAYSYAPLE